MEGGEKKANSFEIASLVPEIWIPRYRESCTFIGADNVGKLQPQTGFLF